MITDKHPSWSAVTLTEANLPNDALPYVLTPADRDLIQIARIDIERHKRDQQRHGLTVTDASPAEWDEAVKAFRGAR